MTNLIDPFFAGLLPLEALSRSNRRLAIRHRITAELENFVGDDTEAINSVLQQAKDRAFQEITQYSPNNVPTPTAEFFQEVFEALSTRLRTFIDQAKDGYRVNVSIPGGLPHRVKDEFATREAARQWRDSDNGDAYINSIIDRSEKRS
jgi:hypothetical protein